MKNLRAGRGLGDSIYLQSIARHLINTKGKQIRVASDYPDVFEPVSGRCQVMPFTRAGIDIVAHYITRKQAKGTSQFTDMCLSAGITDPVELSMEWRTGDQALIDRLKEPGRPILCVQLPRSPMGRTDGFGSELLPNCKAIQRAIESAREWATVVQIGAGEPLYRFAGIDVDLANKTDIHQLIDVAYAAHSFIGYPSFVIPLAESFDKPALIFWSRAGLESKTPFIRAITPEKLLHKKTCRAVVDDQIKEACDALPALLYA